jgi:Asp-tRNA(Asn)/Glu-tRNA(Gln) amidotransferase A subunit family amidase
MGYHLVRGDILTNEESKSNICLGFHVEIEILTSILLSPGQDIVRSVAGPMACSLKTIERYMEVLPDARPWEVDHHVAPVHWRKDLASPGVKRLRIGFVIDDGVVKVQPPIARAMNETIEALREAGHEGMGIVRQMPTRQCVNQCF